MLEKRGDRYLVIALSCFPFVGAVNIVVFGPPNSRSTALWFFVVSAVFCLLVILRVLHRRKNPNVRDRREPSFYFKGAIVFLFGAVYGAWQLIRSGWEWVDLVALAIPVTLIIWLVRLGIAERKRRQSQTSTSGTP